MGEKKERTREGEEEGGETKQREGEREVGKGEEGRYTIIEREREKTRCH